MNSVVDEVLNTSATDNKIKYRITHSDNTSEVVTIDLETPVITQGTALNKVLFDSIESDLNSRLLISSKASNEEAETGTDISKYIVPSTLQYKLQHLNYSPNVINGTSTSTSATGTLYDGTQLTKSNTLLLTGYAHCDTNTSSYGLVKVTFNGTGFAPADNIDVTTPALTSATITLADSNYKSTKHYNGFVIFINKATKTIIGHYAITTSPSSRNLCARV